MRLGAATAGRLLAWDVSSDEDFVRADWIAHTFAGVYERLRKRSYRKWKSGAYTRKEHKAYKQGVLDTINESRSDLTKLAL